jgi:hypothetical protein
MLPDKLRNGVGCRTRLRMTQITPFCCATNHTAGSLGCGANASGVCSPVTTTPGCAAASATVSTVTSANTIIVRIAARLFVFFASMDGSRVSKRHAAPEPVNLPPETSFPYSPVRSSRRRQLFGGIYADCKAAGSRKADTASPTA